MSKVSNTGEREREPAIADEVAKARALAPQLAKRALETIAARRLLDESVGQLKDAGLTNVLLAMRSGGREGSLRLHLDVVAEIARGCGSTGWCLGVYHAHGWLMGLFEERAQDDVYGADRNAILSAVLNPRGEARKVAGGYHLSGFWPFCSGVHHAGWVILGGRVLGEDGQLLDEGVLLLPRDQVTVKDDWYVSGLTGTGSNSVTCTDVHVPLHRFLSMTKAMAGEAPGAHLHASRLYHSALVPALTLFICSPVIGMARHALDGFVSRLPGRTMAYTFGEQQIDMAATHIQVGEAATKIDLAYLSLCATIAEIERYAAGKSVMPYLRRATARMQCAYAVRLCLEATETLLHASGGSALSESNDVQLAARDVRAASMHGLLNLTTSLEMYGRAVLRLSPSSPVV